MFACVIYSPTHEIHLLQSTEDLSRLLIFVTVNGYPIGLKAVYLSITDLERILWSMKNGG